eukprot:scaffold4726_cov128-Cylindrotheca_fusiformis.AAC.3
MRRLYAVMMIVMMVVIYTDFSIELLTIVRFKTLKIVKASSTDGPSDAALSARGGILIRNMFNNGSETIIDVSLVHVDAPSHLSAEPFNVLRTHEKTKKKNYLRLAFSSVALLFLSWCQRMGSVSLVVKKLSTDLVVHWDQQ